MRIAISNIAWDTTEDLEVARLLRQYQIDAIDIAPSKYFSDIQNTTHAQIHLVKQWWHDHGIEITGMQALLFGTQGLNLFGEPSIQQAMLDHLAAVCRIAAGLSAKLLVFGSPKNRNRTGLTDDQAAEIAVNFFQRLGNIAAGLGVIICLEPNPASYGCNFMTNSLETSQLVRKIAHPAIKMQLDTGAMAMNHEKPEMIIQQCADIIGHIHASEPNLIPLGGGNTPHQQIAQALFHYAPEQSLITIEMLATAEPHLATIEQSLKVAIHLYKSPFHHNKR